MRSRGGLGSADAAFGGHRGTAARLLARGSGTKRRLFGIALVALLCWHLGTMYKRMKSIPAAGGGTGGDAVTGAEEGGAPFARLARLPKRLGGPGEAPAAAPAAVAAPAEALKLMEPAIVRGAVAAVQPPSPPPSKTPAPSLPRRALIFTMDSISNYVDGARRGGPAGEILVRESLENGLRALGITVDVASSDAEFEQLSSTPDRYGYYFLDPWTFVSPGWKPRAFLIGREARTYILSFFGMEEAGYGLALDTRHILTPYPVNPRNSFLGFVVPQRWVAAAEVDQHAGLDDRPAGAAGGGPHFDDVAVPEAVPGAGDRIAPLPPKSFAGVVWGKKPSYFGGKVHLLKSLLTRFPDLVLHLAVSGLADSQESEAIALRALMAEAPFRERVVNHGHLTPPQWHGLLASSAFFLGLGDPLAGPSALDALASGCVYINPVYPSPRERYFESQHPYLAAVAGESRVCSYHMAAGGAAGGPGVADDATEAELLGCVDTVFNAFEAYRQVGVAGAEALAPFIPPDFTASLYLERLKGILAGPTQQ